MSSFARSVSDDSLADSGHGNASNSPEADLSSETSGSIVVVDEPDVDDVDQRGNHYHVYQDKFFFRNQHYHVTNRHKTVYKHTHHHHHHHYHVHAAEQVSEQQPAPSNCLPAHHPAVKAMHEQVAFPPHAEGIADTQQCDGGTPEFGNRGQGSDIQQTGPDTNVSGKPEQEKRKAEQPCTALVLHAASKKGKATCHSDQSQGRCLAQSGGKMIEGEVSGQEV